MPWTFEINLIKLGENDDGRRYITAEATQKITGPVNGHQKEDFIMKWPKLQGQSAALVVYSNDSPEYLVDPDGIGFYKIVENNKRSSFAKIRYIEAGDEVDISLYLVPSRYERMWRMGEIILSSPNQLKLQIDIEGICFGVKIPEELNTPTVYEFLRGSPYVGNNIAISISQR